MVLGRVQRAQHNWFSLKSLWWRRNRMRWIIYWIAKTKRCDLAGKRAAQRRSVHAYTRWSGITSHFCRFWSLREKPNCRSGLVDYDELPVGPSAGSSRHIFSVCGFHTNYATRFFCSRFGEAHSGTSCLKFTVSEMRASEHRFLTAERLETLPS